MVITKHSFLITALSIVSVAVFAMLLGCNQQPNTDNDLATNQVNKLKQISSESTRQKPDNSKQYAVTDTIIIQTATDGVIKYSKKDFNTIIDKHSEFFSSITEEPDLLYHCGNDAGEFGGETGKDNYYLLYAHFLKQKNGDGKFSTQRNKLLNIFTEINTLFGEIEYGGTYFGHQYQRILAYAEYSVYLYSIYSKDNQKAYDFSKQKELYIKSLRQLVDDESKIDNETFGKEKIKRNKELNKIVDNLSVLITDNFYLRRVRQFQYGYYENY